MSASKLSGEPVARSICFAIAGFLAAAGGLHLAALPGHLNASVVAAAFFAGTAAAQLLGAMVVATRPSPRALLAVVAGNVAVLALWATSRTTGLPAVGHLGVREPFGLLDGFAAAAEIVVVVVGLAMMARRVKGTGRRSGGRRPALVLVLTWVLAGGAGLAISDGGHHDGGHHDGGHHDGGGHAHSRITSGGPRHGSDRRQPVAPASSREGFDVSGFVGEPEPGAFVGTGHSHDTSVLGQSVTATGCPAGHDCTDHAH